MNSIVGPTNHFKEHKNSTGDISIDAKDVDCDTLSEISTSCSNISHNSISSTIDSHGNCLDINAALNVGSISVQNATNVTFGNRTSFNAPVMIKHLVVNYDKKGNSDRSFTRRMRRPCKKNAVPTYVFLVVFSVTVTASVALLYFLNTLNVPSCRDTTSTPPHYICGFASACTRCQSLFPAKNLCQAYYEPNCGDLRCYCEPECRSLDCRSL